MQAYHARREERVLNRNQAAFVEVETVDSGKAEAVGARDRLDGVGSVSYTHLDVYKRQARKVRRCI